MDQKIPISSLLLPGGSVVECGIQYVGIQEAQVHTKQLVSRRASDVKIG